MGADCKSVGLAFEGSNPSPATLGKGPGDQRKRWSPGPFVFPAAHGAATRDPQTMIPGVSSLTPVLGRGLRARVPEFAPPFETSGAGPPQVGRTVPGPLRGDQRGDSPVSRTDGSPAPRRPASTHRHGPRSPGDERSPSVLSPDAVVRALARRTVRGPLPRHGHGGVGRSGVPESGSPRRFPHGERERRNVIRSTQGVGVFGASAEPSHQTTGRGRVPGRSRVAGPRVRVPGRNRPLTCRAGCFVVAPDRPSGFGRSRIGSVQGTRR